MLPSENVDFYYYYNIIIIIADPVFCTSFLRASKFRQDETQERVRRYWDSRKGAIMKFMNNVDPESTKILSILRGAQ